MRIHLLLWTKAQQRGYYDNEGICQLKWFLNRTFYNVSTTVHLTNEGFLRADSAPSSFLPSSRANVLAANRDSLADPWGIVEGVHRYF